MIFTPGGWLLDFAVPIKIKYSIRKKIKHQKPVPEFEEGCVEVQSQ